MTRSIKYAITNALLKDKIKQKQDLDCVVLTCTSSNWFITHGRFSIVSTKDLSSARFILPSLERQEYM